VRKFIEEHKMLFIIMAGDKKKGKKGAQGA
jgi:hypothetical protein